MSIIRAWASYTCSKLFADDLLALDKKNFYFAYRWSLYGIGATSGSLIKSRNRIDYLFPREACEMVSCLFFWGTIHQWCLETTNGWLWWKRCCIMTRSLERFATRYGEGERKNNFPRPANIEQAKNEKLCIGTTKASRTLPQAIYPGVKFLSRSNNSGNSSNGTKLKIVRTPFDSRFLRLAPSIQWKIAAEKYFPPLRMNVSIRDENWSSHRGKCCTIPIWQDLICIALRSKGE